MYGKLGLVRHDQFEDDVGVFSLLPANQAVAFAKMSRSVRGHGGSVTVLSNEAQGTVFTVRLPRRSG
jgi:sensor histidine kinase regulating citrate/malate metabolism